MEAIQVDAKNHCPKLTLTVELCSPGIEVYVRTNGDYDNSGRCETALG